MRLPSSIVPPAVCMFACSAMEGLGVEGDGAEYRQGPLKLSEERKVPSQELNLTVESVGGATARLLMELRGFSVQGTVPSTLGLESKSSIAA